MKVVGIKGVYVHSRYMRGFLYYVPFLKKTHEDRPELHTQSTTLTHQDPKLYSLTTFKQTSKLNLTEKHSVGSLLSKLRHTDGTDRKIVR
jgi:hypothetical protein